MSIGKALQRSRCGYLSESNHRARANIRDERGYKVQFLNLSSQTIYQGINDQQINLTNIKRGIYLLKISTENGTSKIWKVVKN